MAFNWKTFQTRTLTAIVFAAVMLTGLLWNYWSFFILFSIIHFGCWWEYFKLVEKIYDTKIDQFIKYLFCICGFLVFLTAAFWYNTYNLWWAPFGVYINIKWCFRVLVLICLFAFLFQNKKIAEKAKWLITAGLVYISVSLGLMVYLRSGILNLPDNVDFYLQKVQQGEVTISQLIQTSLFSVKGFEICLIIVFSIWTNDTMAYIVGSLIGKTSLSKISPRKTWEGTIGGIVLTILLALLFSDFFLFSNFDIAVIAGITAVAGTLGDLLESKLKRMAGVKDSGSIMPGHGGFLDRFDSMLLATPAVWLFVYFFS